MALLDAAALSDAALLIEAEQSMLPPRSSVRGVRSIRELSRAAPGPGARPPAHDKQQRWSPPRQESQEDEAVGKGDGGRPCEDDPYERLQQWLRRACEGREDGAEDDAERRGPGEERPASSPSPPMVAASVVSPARRAAALAFVRSEQTRAALPRAVRGARLRDYCPPPRRLL